MAIVCAGCGREYDVTLFQFGRTIHCTCGNRVGLEHRLTVSLPDERPRFIADAMLGRLARWLRTLGFDTAYDDGIDDEELVRRAIEEGRHILTRDRKLFEEWRVEVGLVVDAAETSEQLAHVVRAFGLVRPVQLFRRCRECNAELEWVALEEVVERVPDRVVERLRLRASAGGPKVSICPECGRVYWEGSHTARMRAVVDRVFGETGDGGADRS